jgi:hypothetical protein
MSDHEQLIDIDQAAGMVLAADLTDHNGGVLLPAGATLSSANIASLRRRGINACIVVVAEPDAARCAEDEAAAALERERHQLRLLRLFRRSGGEQATPLLLQLLTDYRRGC